MGRSKRELEIKNTAMEKEILKYQKLKIKYDTLKGSETKLAQKNGDLNNVNDDYKQQLNILKSELEKVTKQFKQSCHKSIGIVADDITEYIEGIKCNLPKEYEYSIINPKNIETKKNLLKSVHEVWIICNKVSLKDQIDISKALINKNIKEFDTIKSLRKYIKEIDINV